MTARPPVPPNTSTAIPTRCATGCDGSPNTPATPSRILVWIAELALAYQIDLRSERGPSRSHYLLKR